MIMTNFQGFKKGIKQFDVYKEFEICSEKVAYEQSES